MASSLALECINGPYSYSHGCTGNEHEREADAGKSFQMQIISPREPPSHARSSPTVRMLLRSIHVVIGLREEITSGVVIVND